MGEEYQASTDILNEKTVIVYPDMAINVGEADIHLTCVLVWVQPENWLCRILRRLLKFTLKIQWIELPKGS